MPTISTNTDGHGHMHAKLAEHEVSIKGFNSRMDGLENKVDKGFETLAASINHLNDNTRPDTWKSLGIIGGAIALVFTASQIILSLTVGPLVQTDNDIELKQEVMNARLMSLVASSSKNEQLQFMYDKQHDIDEEHLKTVASHASEIRNLNKEHITQWLNYQSARITENGKSVEDLHKRSIKNETENKNLRKWINDIDSGDSRG